MNPHPLSLATATVSTPKGVETLRSHLNQVFQWCYDIAGGHLNTMLLLSEVAQPEIPPELRVKTLQEMFRELPPFFMGASREELFHQFRHMSMQFPSLCHLMQLRVVLVILQNMSCGQLVALTSFDPVQLLLKERYGVEGGGGGGGENFPSSFPSQSSSSPSSPSSNPPPASFTFLQNVQKIFQSWSSQTINVIHHRLSTTLLHEERKVMLDMAPDLPFEMLHYLASLLRLPPPEVEDLGRWLGGMNEWQLGVLTRLLVHYRAVAEEKGAADLMVVKESLRERGFEVVAVEGEDQEMEQKPEGEISKSLRSILSSLKLVMVRHPASKLVYGTILKPHPAVFLQSENGVFPPYDCFVLVEASLIRENGNIEVSAALEGAKTVRAEGPNYVEFKKLKIKQTTKQLGSRCRLKFRVKVIVNNHQEYLPNCECESDLIDVCAHVKYLDAPVDDRPVVSEIIPPRGPCGQKCVILGGNFKEGKGLQVLFSGRPAMNVRYHEAGVIVCNVPRCEEREPLVEVKNEPNGPSDSSTAFKIMD